MQTLSSPEVIQFWKTEPLSMSAEFVAVVEGILGEEPEGRE